MDEKRTGIKIYTIIFFVLLVGFIGFLVSEGVRDADYKKKMSPREKIRKEKSVGQTLNSSVYSYLI